MLHYRFVKIDRIFNYNELAEFGSQTSLSANKGVNQQIVRFTPFITPKNYRLRNDFKERVLNPKIFDLSCNPLSDVNMIGF